MRLYADDVPDPNKNVSIHASVKDATFIMFRSFDTPPVSIHASVKDATPAVFMIFLVLVVSIHASVKDATHVTKFQKSEP